MNQNKRDNGQVDSRDEMNLAEIPIASLSRRAGPGVKTLTFVDTINMQGEQRKRTVTITGSDKWGLPTAKDEDVVTGLLLLSYEQGFTSPKVQFTVYNFIQKLCWPYSGQSYKRIKEALGRLVGVTIETDGWWDNKAKAYRTKFFHIIDQITIAEPKDESALSEFTWSETIFASIQANNLKYLNFGLLQGFKSQIAKRLYRILDKRFYKTNHARYNMFELCHEKIGLSRKLQYRSNLIQKLTPAITELKTIGFLEKIKFIGDDVIFYCGERNNQIISDNTKIGIESKAQTKKNNDTKIELQNEISVDPSDPKELLSNELVKRGVDRRWASNYVHSAIGESLVKTADLIEYFDQIVRTDKTKVKFPGGFLRTMLEEEWALPPNFQFHRRQQQSKTNENKAVTNQNINLFEADETYRIWWNGQIDTALKARSQTDREELESEIKEQMQKKFIKELPRWTAELREVCFQQMLNKHIANELKLPSFEEWLQRKTAKNNVVIL